MKTTTLKHGDLVEYHHCGVHIIAKVVFKNDSYYLNVFDVENVVDGDLHMAEWIDDKTFERVFTIGDKESFRYLSK